MKLYNSRMKTLNIEKVHLWQNLDGQLGGGKCFDHGLKNKNINLFSSFKWCIKGKENH